MKQIRLGTIGSGVIVHSVLNGFLKNDGVSLAAVYSRSIEKGQALADEFGPARVYTDMEKFLDDKEVSFVYIATPNSLHYEQAKAALEHGKNVIMEKPFCVRRWQAEELIALAKDRNLYLIDATPTAYLPNFYLLREKLGLVGRIRMVLCNYTQYSSRYTSLLNGEVTNIFNLKYAGGCLSDINYYNLYLNAALFGSPQEIRYFANIFPDAADTSGIVLMRYPDFVSSSAGSKDARGVSMVQIEGEKGFIYIEGGSNGIKSVRVCAGESDETFSLQDEPDRWVIETREITRLLLEENRSAFEERLNVMVRVIGMLESARADAGIEFPSC